MADYYKNDDGTITTKKKKKTTKGINYVQTKSGEIVAEVPEPEKDDIAPVKNERRKWFQAGAFEDGYQFGDVVKSIVGTGADVVTDVAHGVGNFGEGIVDLIMYGEAGLSDLFGDEERAAEMKKKAQKNSVTDFFDKYIDPDIDELSLLGDKSDSIAQGVGYVLPSIGLAALSGGAGLSTLGTSALTTGTNFASNMGSGMSEAYQGGATDSEALKYGVSSGLIEAGTEMIFGGLGKGVNALGISRGIGGLDDIFAKKVSSKISNQFWKNAAQMGVKAMGEGVEEVLAGYGSAVAKKMTYMSDSELKDLVKDENLLESFVSGMFVSGIVQGNSLVKSNKSGTDFVTGLTQNEEAVVDSIYNEAIKEAEAKAKEKGETLSGKEKNKIYDEVVEGLKRGDISVEAIEKALGGDNFKTYDELKAEAEEYKKLFNTASGELSRAQQNRLNELDAKNTEQSYEERLKAEKDKVSQSVLDMVAKERDGQGGYLAVSYNERAKRGQAFEADLSTYKSEKQREIVKKAVESGILNNTRRTHEFVDMVSKISADKGVLFDFTNNERLKESGFAKDGRTINGYVTKDGITLNVNSAKALNSVVGHEITHVLEGTELYSEMQNALFEYARSRKDFEGRKKVLEELYRDVKDADVDAELTADLVGDYLFTDQEFINNLSVKNRNVFQKIYDEIKYLCKLATAGSKEARQLEAVKRKFEQAYKESAKGTTDTKYSISYTTDNKAVAIIENDIFDGKFNELSESERIKIVKESIKSFRPGVPISGRLIGVSRKTAGHFTNSDYTDKIRNNDQKLYEDKLNLAQNIDDVIYASTDYINEDLKHTRTDNITQFARGSVLLDIGGSKYDADVLVGYTSSNEMILYDVQDLTPTTFELKEKKKAQPKLTGNESEIRKTVELSSEDIIPQNSEKSIGNAKFSISDKNIKNVIDNGGYSNGDEGASTVAIAFNSEQVKSTANEKPTSDPDIRFSLTEYTSEEKKAHNKAVLEHFGKTYSWAETGYLLLDGSRLDLSGKHEGAPGGYRTVDHRDIVDALGNDYGNGDYSGSLVQFMSEGNIRIIPECNGINLSVKPTKAQEQALSNYISRYRGEVLLDIDDLNGNTVVSVEYPYGTYYTTVLNDIREWFDNGKKPENAGNYSLTKEGDTPKRFGNYNVKGEDISLDIGPVRGDIAQKAETKNKGKTVSNTENLAPDFAPISEDEANALQSENIASLDDADAPPETQSVPYNNLPGETSPLPKTVVAKIAHEVRNASYGLKNQDVHKVRQLIDEYAKSEAPSREELKESLSEILTTTAREQTDDLLPEIKNYLKNTKIKVSEDIRRDFENYASEQRHYFGKIGFSKNGLSVDSVYQELNELYPEHFPSDVINPADQLRVMMDVADTQGFEDQEYMPDETELDDVADVIINGINGYRQASAQRAAEVQARQTSFAAVHGDIAPTIAENDNIAPIKDNKQGGATQTPKEPGKTAEILTEETEAPKKKERSVFTMARTAVLDKFSVFEDLSLKHKNRELMGKANHMLSSESRAQHMIGEGIKSRGVKSLNEIRTTVQNSGLEQEFLNYLHHKHNVDRMSIEANAKATMDSLQGKFGHLKTEQIYAIAAKEITDKTTARTAETIRQAKEFVAAMNAKNKPVFGDEITADVSRKTAAELEKAHPEFKAWAKDVYDYNNYLREILVKKGVVSQETAELWAKVYPSYVPIRRAGKDGAAINVALDTGKTGVDAPIKRATGGNSDILPMWDTMALRTEQTYKAAAKNAFGVELMNTLGTRIENSKANLDEILDSVDNHEELLKKGQNGASPTFTVFENGERVTFEITEDMYDALKPTSDGLKTTIKPLNIASKVQRGLLTEYNPVFMLTNAIKDAQDVLINSQHAAKTYKNFPKAIKELVTKGKWLTEYIENGGEQNTYFDGESKTFTKDDAGIKKVLGFVPRKISEANNFIERIPRLAEYIASREAGRSIEVSMLDAARVTTNFAAGGDVTKMLNRNGFTFLNASVQGFNQQVRNIREAKANGLKGWVQLAAKVTLAGLSASLLNHLLWDDDEEYAELSDYVKDNYYVIAKNSDGTFVRIPKGRTMAVIQDAFEQMENLITGNDEVDFGNFFELVISNLAPNNPLDNNVIAPISQAITNKTWYGEDLVPTRLQDLPNAEQYDESTDAISKWLGEKINVSPYKLNYLLNQYSGGIGDVVLPMLTPKAERGDNSFGGNLIAPLKDKFTTNAVTNNQNTGDFYDTMDELTKKANSSYATDEDILKYKYFSSINSQLGELYGQKREIQNSDLSDKEKYVAVMEVQKQINDLTRNGLGSYNDVNIDGVCATVGDVQFRWYEPGEDSTSEPGWQKISDKQLEKQEEVTKGLGITPSQYWSNKEEYDFAYEYPARYAVAKSVGGYEAYRAYSSELYDIKADKDADGKSITGSRKKKVVEYINALDADYETKIILYKSEYTSDDRYNYDIVNYLNSREDLSYEDVATILKSLGFKVDSKGRISW